MHIHFRNAFAAALALLLVSTAALAGSDLVVKSSPHSVAQTLDRLEAVMKKKGITIFTRIDHAAGAMKVGVEMAPTQVLIFGSPKMGTPLMQSDRRIGIDLPLKVLAWRDDAGKVWVAYNNPSYLAARHGINDKQKVFAKMTGALNNLTNAAIKP